MRYNNPIIPGFYPDPSICRVGADYYLVTSSFEYFPGVPLFHSRDLVNWRQLGHCLDRPSQIPLHDCRPSKGIWAPTLRWHGGLFYMTTTNTAPSGVGNFMVTASDPSGPWSDPVPLAIDGIDPSLFFDDDGRVYLTTSENRQAEIDPRTGALLSPVRKVWENGTDGGYMEAPHLFKRNGLYYLIVAEGGTGRGHMATVSRARSPWGPFEPCPYNPILTHRHRGGTPIQCTGHVDLVDDPAGNTWAVFLGIRTTAGMFPRYHNLGRETFLAPVVWTDDGWPLVNNREEILATMESPLLPTANPCPAQTRRDDFDEPRLRFDWIHLRNPDPECYSLTARPGWLRLLGSDKRLDDVASPTAVFRRQTAHRFEAAALLDFQSAQEGDEAGLTLLANHRHYYALAIVRRDGRRRVELRLRVCEIAAIQANVEIGEGPVVLKVFGEPDLYRFAFEQGGRSVEVGQAASKLISTEVASGFTGVMIGLYAFSGSSEQAAVADFDWFDHVPLS